MILREEEGASRWEEEAQMYLAVEEGQGHLEEVVGGCFDRSGVP